MRMRAWQKLAGSSGPPPPLSCNIKLCVLWYSSWGQASSSWRSSPLKQHDHHLSSHAIWGYEFFYRFDDHHDGDDDQHICSIARERSQKCFCIEKWKKLNVNQRSRFYKIHHRHNHHTSIITQVIITLFSDRQVWEGQCWILSKNTPIFYGIVHIFSLCTLDSQIQRWKKRIK